MKVAIVAGTRPEVIKLAPLHQALASHPTFDPVWVSTEQQGELNSRALADLAVTPDVRLAPPSPERSVGGRFAQIMDRLDEALARIEPDLVLVQGDTSSTGAGAMAGFARRIPVGHVEAGLRTFDLDRPFPEEAWRCVVGQLATVHFAPTPAAADNLKRAGVASDRIHMTGNTGIDTVRLMGDRILPEPLTDGLRRILVTLHRREKLGRDAVSIAVADHPAAAPLIRQAARHFETAEPAGASPGQHRLGQVDADDLQPPAGQPLAHLHQKHGD